MGKYRWISIGVSADFQQLEAALDPEFDARRIVNLLTGGINAAIKGVLIEYGYVDKDYRSTYYHFYSKMGRPYRADCVRLHFFDQAVAFAEQSLDLRSDDKDLEDHYFGYMVLRPTMVATIGRSVLAPDVRMNAKGLVIHSKHKVHVLGHKLTLWGFPSMDQHADIAVCAHVACWSILRHYSERYAQHRELLVHDITLMAHQFDPGGLVPGNGLDVFEAERVFQAAKTFPLMISKDPKDPKQADAFYRQLLAYLDSGFPLFVSMEGRRHAVVAIGRGWRVEPADTASLSGGNAWDRVESITLIDDNHLPYHCVPVKPAPAVNATPDPKQYSAQDFDRFIVPLPEKIYYPAKAVEIHAPTLRRLLATALTMPPEDRTITRYFITTISSIRRYARKHASQLGNEFVVALMQIDTPQFVWVVEFSSPEQWAKGEISARAVLDASASPKDRLVAWLAHGPDTAIFFDRTTAPGSARIVPLTQQAETVLGRMEENLRPIRQRP
jgi:hypothetical protein